MYLDWRLVMRYKRLLSYSIVLFVLAQLTWFALLGLFVYRFIISRDILQQVEGQLSISVELMGNSIFILVAGCVLYVVVSVAMSIIFKNLNSQLRLTSMYDTFIANVTHELKSPLASIQLYLETLQLRNVDEARRNEFIATMLNDAERLKNLINSILKITILEQKRDIFEYHVYQADTLLKSILEESRQHFKLQQDQIVIQGSAPVDCVMDRNALKIVFNNLIDNAIKYSTQRVQIHVQMAVLGKRIRIQFSDNGIGISTKDQKKIFQKFQRIDNEYTPNVKGTGLGLYWVREIIKYHGGIIRVLSEGKDRGTTFQIDLPIYKMTKKRYLKMLLKWAQRQKQNKKVNYANRTGQKNTTG